MRTLILCLLLALVSPLAARLAHADDLNRYRIQGNLFDDYRPAHQRANPGAEWERLKAQERSRIDREFERKRNKPYAGRIDNRDYSRPGRNDGGTRYHSPDRNHHRMSGRIDNRSYGETTMRSPSARTQHRWIGPDYSPKQATSRTAARPDFSPARPHRPPRLTGPAGEKPEKYYGTRSGEALYPYTSRPVKGAWNGGAQAAPENRSTRQNAKAAYEAAKPRDPSYGGNRAWNIPRSARADTSRFYQDEIARYRREHRPDAYCKDGSISGKGSGACSGHGGLFKRN